MTTCALSIKGIHCRSCEILIEHELKKLPGITSVNVNHNTGMASVSSDEPLDERAVQEVLQRAGYSLGSEELPWFSRHAKDYAELGMAFLMAMGLYFIASSLGIVNISTNHGSNYGNLFTVLAIGLTAGVSTCMALVGGLVLGSSARYAEKHPMATGIQKFTPHIYFNIGRIVLYFILGGVIGWAGSIFQLSTSTLGYLMVAVGGVMLLLGGQLVDIFPRLKKISFTLPKGISQALGIHQKADQEYSHTNAMVSGALTFFLPCGFTQAMQLYAMSTGSPLQGALTMGVFALGTAPGLLGVGGLSSIVKGDGARLFFKTAGVVVIALSFFNIKNGFNLAGGWPDIPRIIAVLAAQPGDTLATVGTAKAAVSGVQEIAMTQGPGGYSPNKFTIQAGVPVRWTITSTDVNTCAASLVSQQIGVRTNLKLGKNVIEFTPKSAGAIRFSCSMGMFTGSFTVVDGKVGAGAAVVTTPNQAEAKPAAAGCGGGGGGCGGCGGAKKQTAPTVGETKTQGEVQILKASYSPETDIVPNEFSVKVGQPVRFEIEAKENGSGCMGSVTVPQLTQEILGFTKGQTTVLEFIPKTKGEYLITCAMGVPRGKITVI
ncbi:MAG: Heavy metal transport/detoxification protein [Microgenomates group bacterium GW2011_GWC2_45_8]|nr:MAG: Heavy metal transport/detoxification protein [Microgenomates group bacterium GW2011_GWC2_45_8]KKU25822.1 MAG: Heavy metal transport/detoxification protein [Microgenomates group bacterium GW2011_GWA2_46_16]